MARPRSDEARRKVVAATTALIVERGVGSLTIEEVASRSGVAKTTIYRHWPDRASLVLDAVHSQFERVRFPDTGSLRGDLRAFFGLMHDRDLSGTVGGIMPCVMEAAGRDPDMARLIEQVGAEREGDLLRIIDRARARGELATHLDSERLAGVLLGPIVFQKVMRRRPLTPEYVETCLDVVLAGIAALERDTGGAVAPPVLVD